jgi:hypothetical protein
MPTGTDIAREMARLFEVMSVDGALSEVQRRFPGLSTAELVRACVIGVEAATIAEERQAELAGDIFDAIVGGAPKSQTEPMIVRLAAPLTADRLFPTPTIEPTDPAA